MSTPEQAAELAAATVLGSSVLCTVRAFERLCRFMSLSRDADHEKALTSFHSASEPKISLLVFLARLAKYGECGAEGIAIGLAIACRYCRHANMLPSVLSMHRLLLASITLGAKAHYDRHRSNRTMAKVGGIPLPELNEMELEVFRGADHRIVCATPDLTRMMQAAQASLGIPESENFAVAACQAFYVPNALSPGRPVAAPPVAAGASSPLCSGSPQSSSSLAAGSALYVARSRRSSGAPRSSVNSLSMSSAGPTLSVSMSSSRGSGLLTSPGVLLPSTYPVAAQP
jgi:hypothetical protein